MSLTATLESLKYETGLNAKPVSTFETRTRLCFFQSQALQREWRLRQFLQEFLRMKFFLVSGRIFPKNLIVNFLKIVCIFCLRNINEIIVFQHTNKNIFL